MSRYILLVFLALGFAERRPIQAQVWLSPKQMDTLLVDIHAALVAYHPFAYRGDGAKQLATTLARQLERRSERYTDGSDSLALSDIQALVAPFNVLMGDGHFQLKPVYSKAQRKTISKYQYRLPLRYVEDGRYVLTDTLRLRDSTTYLPGVAVTAIDGFEIDSLLGRYQSLLGLDDHARPGVGRFLTATNPIGYYQREGGFRDSVTVTLAPYDTARDGFAERRTVQLYADSTTTQSDEKLSKRELAQQRMRRLITLDTLRDTRLRELHVATFSNSAYRKAKQYKYVTELFGKITQDSVLGLVIDVRGNTGGSLDFVEHILSFVLDERFVTQDTSLGYAQRAGGKNPLARLGSRLFGQIRKRDGVYVAKGMFSTTKPQKLQRGYRGPLVVLVNEMSFSGATTLANVIQQTGRGVVIGQVPGGSAERMYAGRLFEVPVGPGKAFKLNMPLYFMDMVGDAKGNLQPDVIVPRLAEDIVNDYDRALELAIAHLQQYKEQ